MNDDDEEDEEEEAYLFCRAMASLLVEVASSSWKPLLDSLHSARNIKKASLCMMEGNEREASVDAALSVPSPRSPNGSDS